MAESPAISVIVATYKGQYLRDTLASISAQTYPDFEVLVLDDANEVSCRRIVASMNDQRFLYFANQTPLRPALNHLKGIRLARGRRITVLNHDDLWAPTALETLNSALDREPTAVAAFSRSRVVNEHGEFDEKRTSEAWSKWGCNDYPIGLTADWTSVPNKRPAIPAVPAMLVRASALKSFKIPAAVGGIGGRPHVSVCVRPDVSVSGRFMMPVPPLV
jgi:glycosyltransferase involved in cell wall biosynthesis